MTSIISSSTLHISEKKFQGKMEKIHILRCSKSSEHNVFALYICQKYFHIKLILNRTQIIVKLTNFWNIELLSEHLKDIMNIVFTDQF